jgi:hypothetical protein
VTVGDTELVGVAFGVGVDLAVGDDLARVGAGTKDGDGDGCPVVEGFPTVAAGAGLTST